MAARQLSPAPPRPARQPLQLSRPKALWLQALMLITFMAASSAPTPLYGIYRAQWGFSATTLTVIFGVYAISLLLALLVLGSLSDHIGRKPVIIGALMLNAVSMAVFMTASSVPLLLVARLVQGVATGAATSVLAAGLMDLDNKRSPMLNSVAPMIGLAVGALGASLLVQFAPAPLRMVYAILLAVLVIQAVTACFLPETAAGRPGVWAAMRPTVIIPGQAWRGLLAIAPTNVAGWALGGFYLSLGPTLVAHVTGMHAPVVGGLMVFVLTMAAAASVLLLRSWASPRMLAVGSATLMVGVAITLAGVASSAALLFFVGTFLSGAGFGAAFLGALRSLVPMAQPHERAGVMAAFYIMNYLAFCLPAILAGVLTSAIGLTAAANYYGAALIVLTGVALAGNVPFLAAGYRRKRCSS